MKASKPFGNCQISERSCPWPDAQLSSEACLPSSPRPWCPRRQSIKRGPHHLALAFGLLLLGTSPAPAQTAGSQVEMFLGPSIGKQWTAIFSNHPRTTGTAPALTSCGTSPTIVGTDSVGTVTTGTGTPTGCVITFAAAYAAAPYCVVAWRTNIASMIYAISTTAITLTQTATDSTVVDYMCVARSGG